MKHFTHFLSSLLLMICLSGSIQAQTIAALEEKPLVSGNTYKSQKVTDDGTLIDENNTKLGTIEADGTLKNASGAVIGKVVQNTKDVTMYDFYNNKGKIVATIGPAGMVKDMEGRVLYTVDEPDETGYCNVYDAKNRQIGLIHEKRRHEGACLMHSKKK